MKLIVVVLLTLLAAHLLVVSPLAGLLWFALKLCGLHAPFLAVWIILTLVVLLFGRPSVEVTERRRG